MPGNNLMGFYSTVQGYNSNVTSPLSVVAYRVNSDSTNLAVVNRLERMGKGIDLEWRFYYRHAARLFLPLTLDTTWPSVASTTAYDDPNPTRRSYQTISPQVFRFEYYYLDRATGALTENPAGWTSPSTVAIKDASAIVVAVAVINDQESRAFNRRAARFNCDEFAGLQCWLGSRRISESLAGGSGRHL